MSNSSYHGHQGPEGSAATAASVLDIGGVNYVLGGCYIILGVLSFIQVITKYKAERKVKTNVVFPAEIFFLCLVRASYFFCSLTTWANDTPKFVGIYMFFIDTFPELIFVAIYVLLVSSWGVTWAKARRARPFAPYQFWVTYCCIVSSTFLVSIILSIVAQQLHISYERVLLWEAAYLVALSSACITTALIFGLKLYWMLGETAPKSAYLDMTMRQLRMLVVLATVSFVLKAAWVFTISTQVRSKWVSHQWSNIEFGIFWFFYYSITELLPFTLVWFVLQRKEVSAEAAYKCDIKLTAKSSKSVAQSPSVPATNVLQSTNFAPLHEEPPEEFQNEDEPDRL